MQKFWLLLIIVICPGLLGAQSPHQLTLEECIYRAGQYSFRLQSDDYEITAAEKTASIVQSQAIPRIDGELATENRFLKPFIFNQTWASVHADWSLGDYLKKTGRSAAQDIETQRLIKEQNRLVVIGRSTSLYMSILQVMKQIDIIALRIGLLKTHHELSKGLWKAGMRSQLDVLQTEAEIIKLREDTSSLAVVRDDLRNELSQLLGWENADSLHLMPLRVDLIAAAPVPEVNRMSLSDNPVLTSFDSKIKAQNFRTDEITAVQYPHLRMGSGLFADGDPSGDGHYFQINAGVVVPIYYGHEPEYKKQWSRAIVQSLDFQKLEAERELVIHLTGLHDRLVKLKELLDLQNARRSIAGSAVEIAEMNYRAGISTNLEFITAQEQLTNIELSIEETHLEYTMGLIEYFINTNQVDQIISMGK